MNTTKNPQPRILTIDEVLATYTRCSAACLYRWIAAGTFPEPVQLSAQHVGWNTSEVEEWLKTRAAGVKRRSQPARGEI